MILSWRAEKIVVLLADGTPYRDIAKIVGVSRDTVQRIANGSRPDYALQRKATENGDGQEDETKPPGQCGICGATVFLPCRACRTRASMRRVAREPVALREEFDDKPLALMLRPGEQERYEKIRAARRRIEQRGLLRADNFCDLEKASNRPENTSDARDAATQEDLAGKLVLKLATACDRLPARQKGIRRA